MKVVKFTDAADNCIEESERFDGTIVGGRSESTDDGAPGFEVGKITRAKHGFEDGGGIEGVAGLGGGNGEKAETIGIKTVELALMAEARDDGLGARERQGGILKG